MSILDTYLGQYGYHSSSFTEEQVKSFHNDFLKATLDKKITPEEVVGLLKDLGYANAHIIEVPDVLYETSKEISTSQPDQEEAINYEVDKFWEQLWEIGDKDCYRYNFEDQRFNTYMLTEYSKPGESLYTGNTKFWQFDMAKLYQDAISNRCATYFDSVVTKIQTTPDQVTVDDIDNLFDRDENGKHV